MKAMRAVLVRTFCHVCDRERDHDLSELPEGTYAAPGTTVRWWCLGCGKQIDMCESWGITLDGVGPYQQAAA